MSNSWSLLRLCGPRSRKQFGNAAFLIVLPHNSHHHITVEMWSTTFPQMLTCRIRDSSTTMGTVYPCLRRRIPCSRAAREMGLLAPGARRRRRTTSPSSREDGQYALGRSVRWLSVPRCAPRGTSNSGWFGRDHAPEFRRPVLCSSPYGPKGSRASSG